MNVFRGMPLSRRHLALLQEDGVRLARMRHRPGAEEIRWATSTQTETQLKVDSGFAFGTRYGSCSETILEPHRQPARLTVAALHGEGKTAESLLGVDRVPRAGPDPGSLAALPVYLEANIEALIAKPLDSKRVRAHG